MRTTTARLGLALVSMLTSLALIATPSSAFAATSTPDTATDATISAAPSDGAHIQNGWGYVTQGNLRANPNLNLNPPIIVTIYNQWVDIVCWIDGGPNGFGSNRWFKANYFANTGYLSSGVVSSQPAVGHC